MARTSSSNTRPTHYIVDGSNIATEGRSMPSLTQLNDAVLAFIEEHPEALITVVVDATFGHRIDKKDVKSFDDAVANNELVTPPAGAVGRGDAFVLSIAHKAKAGILSNDSFQEFHGEYPWLFDEGRLIGGKPVPHVGWVFVPRNPVRGPKSRQSVKDAKQSTRGDGRSRTRGSGSPLADQPMPVPSAPPPGPAVAAKSKRGAEDPSAIVTASKVAAASPAAGARTPVNDLLPFLDFVERHPVGTACTVVVESYASHGAYARAGDVLVYLPLRLMGEPQPRSARSAVTIGEAISVVIVGYVPERRSIDAALPSAGDAAARTVTVPPAEEPAPTKRRARAAKQAEPTPEVVVEPAAAPEEAPSPKSRRRRAAQPAPEPAVSDAAAVVEPQPAPKRRRAAAKTSPTAEAGSGTADATPTSETPAKPARSTAKKTAKASAKKPATKSTTKTAAKAAPAAAASAPAAKKTSAAKKAPSKRSAAKKASTTKAPET